MGASDNVSRRGFLRGAAGIGAFGAAAFLAGCGESSSSNNSSNSNSSSDAGKKYKVEMVTDTGGVNDQSFNSSSWQGLQKLQDEEGWDVSYLESKQESDYATNLDKAVDDEANLIWGIGFAMADAVGNAAKANPDVQFAIIDNVNPTGGSNITGVTFRAQESCFMCGYIAARFSKSAMVGFIGGITSDVIDQFEYGYRAGIDYANKEQGLNVQCEVQYADSFSDSAKGKSIANKMFSDGCDVVIHAAGGVGVGVIDAAKDAGKYAIGADLDQGHLAPENVLTSALKKCNVAVDDVSKRLLTGDLEGGSSIDLGLSDDAVGIPENHDIMGDEIYNAAIEVGDKIKSGDIVPLQIRSSTTSTPPVCSGIYESVTAEHMRRPQVFQGEGERKPSLFIHGGGGQWRSVLTMPYRCTA